MPNVTTYTMTVQAITPEEGVGMYVLRNSLTRGYEALYRAEVTWDLRSVGIRVNKAYAALWTALVRDGWIPEEEASLQ